MIKIRSAMFLLLAFVPSAFAAAVDAMPHTGYFFMPMVLAVFSFLVMVRFLFFSEKNRKNRKAFLILLLFLVIVLLILPFILAHHTELGNLSNILAEFLFFLIIPGIIATAIGLITTFFLIYKKNEFITESIPVILGIDIAIVILAMIDIFLMLWLILILNVILGIIFVIRLLISLLGKNKRTDVR